VSYKTDLCIIRKKSQTNTTVVSGQQRSQRKRQTRENLGIRFGKTFQIQLEEDEGSSTGQTELNGEKWSEAYVPLGATKQKIKQVHINSNLWKFLDISF